MLIPSARDVAHAGVEVVALKTPEHRRSAPTASELLTTPGAVLNRSHLRDLGLGRKAIDAVFRELDVVVLPGHSRPYVKRDDYLALLERSTYRDDRVRLAA